MDEWCRFGWPAHRTTTTTTTKITATTTSASTTVDTDMNASDACVHPCHSLAGQESKEQIPKCRHEGDGSVGQGGWWWVDRWVVVVLVVLVMVLQAWASDGDLSCTRRPKGPVRKSCACTENAIPSARKKRFQKNGFNKNGVCAHTPPTTTAPTPTTRSAHTPPPPPPPGPPPK